MLLKLVKIFKILPIVIKQIDSYFFFDFFIFYFNQIDMVKLREHCQTKYNSCGVTGKDQ